MPSSHHIIVNVPGGDDRNTIFVAMPFSKTFDLLYRSIERAALKAGLTPVRTDINPGNIDFVQDMKTRIRKALIVLAACIPEVKGGSPNPNVMYELGYAHSIGKSTIIITDDYDNLPSDIRNYKASKDEKYTKYTKGDESNPAFLGELTAQIWKAKDKIKEDGLTSKDFDDINGAHSGLLMFMTPKLEKYFVTIITFVYSVYNIFTTLHNIYIKQLFKIAYKISTGKNSTQEKQIDLIISYQEIWNEYLKNYNFRSNAAVLKGLSNSKDKFDEAFIILYEGSDLQTQKLLNTIKEYNKTMIQKISTFENAHNKLKAMLENGLFPAQLRNKQALFSYTWQLEQDAGSLISIANSILWNFNQDFLRENEIL